MTTTELELLLNYLATKYISNKSILETFSQIGAKVHRTTRN